ncbi:MAG: tetratricopeptide repeat protein [Acidobacteriota bacterium]|nr:tetratricopeptide repeat protein [Acidobacteriota bacterium]
MKFFQSIIIFAFCLFNFALQVSAQDENVRASAAWQVKKYDITATLPTAADRFLTAKAVLNLQNVGNGAGSRLTLRVSPGAEVSAVTVNNSTAAFTKGEEKLGTSRTLQRIIVTLPSVQPNGTTTVAVDYKLKVDENSGLNTISPVGSQFLPLSFWYPTPNSHYAPRGADFAPFRLTVNAPAGETIVSSGTAGANAFEQKLNGQPFFVTGNWDTLEVKGVTVYLPKGASEAEKQRAGELANLAVEAKTFTASLLGTATETPTRIIAVRRGAGFSDAGAILLDYGAFRRQKVDSLTAMTIAEAVAKTWLGNASLVRGEGYGAVREGLSRFIATQFIEKQFGKDVADIERLRQRMAYAAVARRDAPLAQVTPLDDYFYASTGNKGAMIWRIAARNAGQAEFFNAIRPLLKEGNLTLSGVRAALATQKESLDYWFDQATDMNLLVGLPQAAGADTKVALRNLGAIAVNVTVVGLTDKGEKVSTQVTIPPQSFGEAVFKTPSKIIRAEIDPEKLLPQVDFSDDIAPREFIESDALLVIKRAFDKQEFAAAEKSARTVLVLYPRLDDARIWLARSLLAQNRAAEAEKEFRAVLDEKLPTGRSLAWANLGLGEIAAKSNQNAQAAKYFEEAIRADAEYGATLAARAGRSKTGMGASVDESVKAFFAQFDKAAVSGTKVNVDALIIAGEIPRFSGGVSGAQEWRTTVLQVDRIDANNVLAEVQLNIRLLNRDPESGTAVFLLSKVGSNWKLNSVEMFEVR